MAARTTLKTEVARGRRRIGLAIENHQDLTSDELLAIAEDAGGNVGLCSTRQSVRRRRGSGGGARRAAHRINHVHPLDHVAHFTPTAGLRCATATGATAGAAAVLDGDLTARRARSRHATPARSRRLVARLLPRDAMTAAPSDASTTGCPTTPTGGRRGIGTGVDVAGYRWRRCAAASTTCGRWVDLTAAAARPIGFRP